VVSVPARRQQVAYAQGRGLSSRRACALLAVARSTLGYQSRLIVRDTQALVPDEFRHPRIARCEKNV